MQSSRVTAIVLSLLIALSFSTLAAQFETIDELATSLDGVEEKYLQVYIDDDASTATPVAERTVPQTVSSFVFVTESDEEATVIIEMFRIALVESDAYEVKEIEDLGDEAIGGRLVGQLNTSDIVIARDGNVIVGSMTESMPDDSLAAENIVRYMVEHGPTDEAVEITADGVVTGGWADSFPQPGDVEELTDFAPAPVLEHGPLIPETTPTPRPCTRKTASSQETGSQPIEHLPRFGYQVRVEGQGVAMQPIRDVVHTELDRLKAIDLHPAATDVDGRHGSGVNVPGCAIDLLVALTGRSIPDDAFNGNGAIQLHRRRT